MIAGGMSCDDIAKVVFEGIPYTPFDEFDAEYRCTCCRENYLRALISLNDADMTELEQTDEDVECCCRFCGKKYTFTLDELRKPVQPPNQTMVTLTTNDAFTNITRHMIQEVLLCKLICRTERKTSICLCSLPRSWQAVIYRNWGMFRLPDCQVSKRWGGCPRRRG